MVIVAIIFSIVPIILSFGMPDWYLGDTQNAVDDVLIEEDEVFDDTSSGVSQE